MSAIIDDLMDCITIEICMGKIENVIVICVYRKPGSNIEIFTVNMERMFNKVKRKVNNICDILIDFNIDLLKFAYSSGAGVMPWLGLPVN